MTVSNVQNPSFRPDPNGVKLVGGDANCKPLSLKNLDPNKYDNFQLDDILDEMCQKLDPDKDTAIYDPNNMWVKIGGGGNCIFGCDCASRHRFNCTSFGGDETISNVDNCFRALQKSIGDNISKEQNRLDQFNAYSEEKNYYLDLLDKVGFQHKGHCVHKGVTMTEDKYGFSAGKFVSEAELKDALKNVTEKIGKLVSPEKSKTDILSMPRGWYNFNAAAIVEATGLKGDCFEQITKDNIMFSYDGLTEENFIEWTNEKIAMLTEKSEGFKKASEQFDDLVRKDAADMRFHIVSMNAQELYKTLSGKSDDDIRLSDGSMPKELNAAYRSNYDSMTPLQKMYYIDTTSVAAMFENTSEVRFMIAMAGLNGADNSKIAEHIGNIGKRLDEAYAARKFTKREYYQLCKGLDDYAVSLTEKCTRSKLMTDMIRSEPKVSSMPIEDRIAERNSAADKMLKNDPINMKMIFDMINAVRYSSRLLQQ